MTHLQFTVPGAPVGKGRPRAFRRGAGIAMHTPEKTEHYEALVRLAAGSAMSGRRLFDGPVSVSVRLAVLVPQSWSNKKRADALEGRLMPTTKPDVDNVLKALFDAMNGVVWVDDKQVVEVHAGKHYNSTACAVVEVRAVEVMA